MSELLLGKIAAVRRKQASVAAGQGIPAMIAAAVLLLAAGMLIDWWLDLSHTLRTAFLAFDFAVLTYLCIWYVLAPILFAEDDESIALRVERAIPDFRTRLIASVQLSQPRAVPAGASSALVRAMVGQTEELARPMDFTRIIPAQPAVRMSILASVILVLGMAGYLWARPVSPALLQRIFLSDVPVPRKTQVLCITQSRRIALGDSLVLEAEAQGVIPQYGTLEIAYNSGRKQEFTIDPVQNIPGRFSQNLENVQESFKYRIRLNDGRSSWYRIDALPRPAVLAVEFHQHFPAYTNRPPQRLSPGDLSLLAGSKLQVSLKSSKPLSAGVAQLVGLSKEKRLAVTGDKAGLSTPNEADRIDIPAKGLSGISFRLIDDQGIASTGETVYPIDVSPDREPTIRILYPDRKEELATQQARILISFETTDDFGVAKVLLWYRREGDENAPAKSIELDLSDQTDRNRILRRYEFNLGALRPLITEGTAVEYWLEVQDANDKTGPGKALSERFRVKVVSELEKRADLANRLNDQLGAIDYVTQDQEKLNLTLGKLILEKK